MGVIENKTHKYQNVAPICSVLISEHIIYLMDFMIIQLKLVFSKKLGSDLGMSQTSKHYYTTIHPCRIKINIIQA